MTEVPSKYDIIPIHTSDVGSFLTCRRKWHWSSPTRTNLRRRIDVHGFDPNLWFGSGIHYALEMYYTPGLSRDPVEAFQTWYQYQWEGGVVTEDWLERVYDAKPERFVAVEPGDGPFPVAIVSDTPYWKIRGIKDIHPNPIHEEFLALKDLGIKMMEFYRNWAPKHNTFEIIAEEATFSVPLYHPVGGVLKCIDTREESPNYGKPLEVHLRGKRDVIVRDLETGLYGIRDYKTAAQIGEDYFTKLENDPQCLTYMYASAQEASIYDLPYKRIDFVDYEVLWKAYPTAVKVLKNGISPSLSRTEQTCTADAFAEYIKVNELEGWYEAEPKAQGFYNFLVESGDERYINRHRQFYNQTQIDNVGYRVSQIAMDMLDPNLRIYTSPSGSRSCTRCQFRAPCLAMDDGSDWESMIDDGYEQNRGR